MVKYLLTITLLIPSYAFAVDAPLEFFDNEEAVNSILECVASAEPRGNLNEKQDCQEKCEDSVPSDLVAYKLCKQSCAEVYGGNND